MKKRFCKVLSAWMPFAVMVTVLSGTIYLAAQQSLRMSANDPQIQIAEDLAVSLSNNQNLADTKLTESVDMKNSLAAFSIVLDSSGKLVTSSGYLNGANPLPPAGSLEYAKSHDENRLTWQPEPGVRDAIVIKYFDGASKGYAVSGRSLKEVEVRESSLTEEVFLGWLLGLAATLFCLLVLKKD